MTLRPIESNNCETIVIGAGPFGLAVAAHLKAQGVATRVFGEPMSFWRNNMPKGMKLRSPWGATSIADPNGALSLDAYVEGHGLQRVEPLPIETFVDYGDWFLSQAAPDLDRRMVSCVEKDGGRFRVTMMDGEIFSADRVVVAMGLANQQARPEVFADAPPDLVSHTSDHTNFERFRGKTVAVVGRGQSACETAALLSETGATAQVICRGPIHWLGANGGASSWKKIARATLSPILAAPSAVGRFPLNWLAEVPGVTHAFPSEIRLAINASTLRAGAAGWLLPRFGAVGVSAGDKIVGWATKGERIELKFNRGAADFDHVVLATGYKIDIAKLGVLAPSLLAAIACRDGSPILKAGLESSAPGLHFVGANAVSSFGPLLRFIAGAGFAARQVAHAAAPTRKLSHSTNVSRVQYDLAGSGGRGARS
jgi:cation diffusion facilitator CzcD-associated flavoprotein CzcO